MNQPPLNPDALRRAADEFDADMSHCCCGMNGVMQCDYCMGKAEDIVTAYLAAAPPEVTSVEELDQLPLGTTVLGADRISYQMLGQSSIMGAEWWASGSEHRGIEVELPARVLHRPSEQP